MGASHADQTHGGGREQANRSKELHYDILPYTCRYISLMSNKYNYYYYI